MCLSPLNQPNQNKAALTSSIIIRYYERREKRIRTSRASSDRTRLLAALIVVGGLCVCTNVVLQCRVRMMQRQKGKRATNVVRIARCVCPVPIVAVGIVWVAVEAGVGKVRVGHIADGLHLCEECLTMTWGKKRVSCDEPAWEHT